MTARPPRTAPAVPETIAALAEGQGAVPGAHIRLSVRPIPAEHGVVVENGVPASSVTAELLASVEQGILEWAARGVTPGRPLTGIHVLLLDGRMEAGASERAFREAGGRAFLEGVRKSGTRPVAATFRANGESASPLGRIPRPLLYLAIGLASTLLFGSCGPGYILGEGMSFFVHELGHTISSNAFGRFAVPVIVMTIHFEQSLLAAGAIWALLAFFTWRHRDAKPWVWALVAACVLYPVLAFTTLYDTLSALAGHGAEVLIAGVFLWRGMVGGYFHEWERPIYATFGCYLWIRNGGIFSRILFNAQFRDFYSSVSFTGGDNDLLMVANKHALGLSTVTIAMLAFALAFPALAVALAWRSGRGRGPAATKFD